MSCLRRAILYIKRNTTKSILLFLVVFIMGLLISGGVIMSESLKNVETEFVKRTGAVITIDFPLEDNQYEASWSDADSDKDTFYEKYNSKLLAIEEMDEVESINYSIYMMMWTDCLYVENNYWDNYFPLTGDSYYKQVLWGVNEEVYTDLSDYTINIVEGRTFTEEELAEGSYVCIINEDLMIDVNGTMTTIEVGDSIPLKLVIYYNDSNYFASNINNIVDEEEIYFTVIGKYHSNVDSNSTIAVSNRVYTTNNAVRKIISLQSELEEESGITYSGQYKLRDTTRAAISSVTIKLNNVDNLETFRQKLATIMDEFLLITVDALGNQERAATIYTSTDAYQRVGWVIEVLEGFVDKLLIVSPILFVLILSLVLFIFLKSRQKEIAIYMSLGEKVGNIVKQLTTELLIIGAIGVGTSLVAASLLSEPISQLLLNSSIIADSETKTTDSEGNAINRITSVSSDDVKEMYTVEINASQYIEIVVIEFGTLIIANITCVLFVTKEEPRDILLG